ncbi:hypothetical protein KZX50_16590 [Bacillus infantis]|uniref:hypothetical protein n=1 Tax=Bacillus infantis TaxID=324767 RepID=UPI00200433D1|nr:hypothetical protein [Bacillus infantis]MCK6207063.1 hypothetical protein [Bacillus infantis]
MALSVKNFRGDTYFLHSRLTKKGNISYHFSKKPDGAADIQDVPEGYEIYEEPNGKVYLRKKTISPIKADELRLIEGGMKKYSIIEDFKLDVKKDAVYIYQVVDSFDDGPVPKPLLQKYKQYETSLRFTLIDKNERTFEVERFCYIGSIDDWIYLDGPDQLERLVREYTEHLGKESFYELM